ncbi:hypothetical protein CBL_01605 [Carabus blaptoides fortunei]
MSMSNHSLLNVMTAQVTGIGVGSFILFSIWIVACILCLVALRTKKLIGVISIIVASIITFTLLLIPLDSKDSVPEVHKDKDYQFVWKTLLATVLGLCALGSITIFLTEHCIDPQIPQPIRTWLIEK